MDAPDEVADSPTWAHPVVLSDGFLIKDLKTLARLGGMAAVLETR